MQQEKGRVVLVLGGVRSGKSRFAQQLAEQSGEPVTFIATAERRDDQEMLRKIERHVADRPAVWSTVEEPLQLGKAIGKIDQGTILIDCLTMFAGKLLDAETSASSPPPPAVILSAAKDPRIPSMERTSQNIGTRQDPRILSIERTSQSSGHRRDSPIAPADEQIQNLCDALRAADNKIILVSNEVGSGVVPAYALGRQFRDLLGEINQRVAALADVVVLMVAGLPMTLKGAL